MSIEFNDDQKFNQNQRFAQADEPSKLAGMIMKWGLAESEEGANKVLIGVAVTSFLLTLFVIFKFIL